MKISALKKLGFFFTVLGICILPQIAFAYNNNCHHHHHHHHHAGFEADHVYFEITQDPRHIAKSQIIGNMQWQAILLSDAIKATFSASPWSAQALAAIQVGLQLNATELANLIVSFNPSQVGQVTNLANLFNQFNQYVVGTNQQPGLLQNAFSPQPVKDAIIANINNTALQIAQAVGQVLPEINPTTLVQLSNPYIVGLINQINFFGTAQTLDQFLLGMQAEIATHQAAKEIGAYVAIGALLQQYSPHELMQP